MPVTDEPSETDNPHEAPRLPGVSIIGGRRLTLPRPDTMKLVPAMSLPDQHYFSGVSKLVRLQQDPMNP